MALEPSRVIEIFCILTWMMVTWVYIYMLEKPIVKLYT